VRVAAFDDAGDRRHGLVVDDQIHPLPAGIDLFSALDDVRDQDRMLAACSAPVPLTSVRLLAPVQPSTVRDFFTFEEHVEGVRRSVEGNPGVPEQWYEAPTFYFTNPYSILGPADDVPVPPGCQAMDFELEVAAVIGRPGRDLTPVQARDHIVGYTIFNDWSARDLQRAEMRVGLGPAKGKDTATTLGPWLVTADELEPYRDPDGFLDLELTASINGRRVGHDRLSHMGWTFEEMVAYASRGTWVRPGDLLGSGTCGNGGCLAELWGRNGTQTPSPLQPGDVVTLTVEGIGEISNTVIAGVEPVPLPTARHRLAERGSASSRPKTSWPGGGTK
jgi:2-keto-4-pentenoate hydratase/2-oxohepta-3-ene-1,7-dioic acid hydratase in catechol pathway